MRPILVVDDEPAVVDVLAFALRKGGFSVETAASLAEARRRLTAARPALLVLDLGLPDGDGLDLCREAQSGPRTPVLVLTCRDDEVDRVLGLESGADDYVVKPFSPRELVARVRAILRRAHAPEPESEAPPVALGDLVVDPGRRRATLKGAAVPLTRIEFDLLHALVRARDRVLTRDELIDRVYRGEALVSDRTIDSHVKGVRLKFQAVDPAANPIETVLGVGYRARGGI